MKAIVAVDEGWGIGREGGLLHPISADLKRFKALTMGHPVLLGRKTLATFPGGRPLPGRRNLVLSRDPDFAPEGCEVFRDLDSLLEAAPEDSIVIGGGTVYEALLERCDLVWVTKIQACYPADTWFPDLDAAEEWHITEESQPLEEKGTWFRYVTYERKGSR